MLNLTLTHEGNNVREFYCKLPRPVQVGIEARGSMQWFLNLMDELGIATTRLIHAKAQPLRAHFIGSVESGRGLARFF